MSLAAPAPQENLRFLTGSGEMGQAIASFDWSATSLGSIEAWPASLKATIALVLHAAVPMVLWWGVDGLMFCNTNYTDLPRPGHPLLPGTTVQHWPEAAALYAQLLHTGRFERSAIGRHDNKLVLQGDDRAGPARHLLGCSPVVDETGQAVGMLGVVTGTADKALAETWLQAERDRLRQMFEQSPGFMAVLHGPNHVFDLVNPAYLQLVGHRQLIGLTVRQALPEVVAQGFCTLVDKVFNTGQPYAAKNVAVTLHKTAGAVGEEHFIDFVYQPLRDPSGLVVGLFVQGADVTDRVTNEKAVRASEMWHRQILDSAVDYAIIATDLSGQVTRWNKGAWRIFGWPEQAMLGQQTLACFTAEDQARDALHTEMRLALALGAASNERWHVRRSGQRFWATSELTPIFDASGKAAGFVKVLRDQTEQHRAAQALRQSEQRLQRAQEAGGVGTFTVDLETHYLSGTREFFKIFGLDDSDSVPAARLEALVIEEDAHLKSAADTRDSRQAPLDVEYRIRRENDGALRWIARKAEFEADASGQKMHMVGVVHDITERKLAQQALEESAAQFQTFAQALPNHVWTAPPNGLLDWFNDRVYEYSGLAVGELDGQGWARIVHPDDVAAAASDWAGAVATGEPYETEFRLRHAGGAYRWHLARAIALRAADGSISRWVGTNTDIHERKLAEAQSTRDRDRLWSLSQELMLVCNYSGTISAINPAGERLLGWRHHEMAGQNLLGFVHPDDVKPTLAEVAKLTAGATTFAFENRCRAKNGSYHLLNWTAVPDSGNIHAVGRDVTRERSAEDALRQSQKMEAVGQLTGGVAHDFNNLLTIIQNSIELLRRPELPEERRQRFMTSIANAVTRAGKLTGQLLAFARRQTLKPVVFDAAQNVLSISEMISTLVGSRIDVKVNAGEPNCIVNADASQLDTAIVNMAVNARDAMKGTGQLTIGVKRLCGIPASKTQAAVAGEFVGISLSDTGGGIEPQHLEKIFEPFFTTKGVGLGTGLGLSQVFGFAKQSGGDVHVESNPGEGTTFTLYLPATAAVGVLSMPAEPVQPVPQHIDGRGACILVVEDNLEVAMSVEDTLRALSYTTVTVYGGPAALAELDRDSKRFAAVFSDVVMGGMDGIELAQEIRRRHRSMPIVLSSGYSQVLAQKGAHGFDLLHKPYTVSALSQVLQSAIDHGADNSLDKHPPALHNGLNGA